MVLRLRRAVLHPSLVQHKTSLEEDAEDHQGSVDVDSLIAKLAEREDGDEEGTDRKSVV